MKATRQIPAIEHRHENCFIYVQGEPQLTDGMGYKAFLKWLNDFVWKVPLGDYGVKKIKIMAEGGSPVFDVTLVEVKYDLLMVYVERKTVLGEGVTLPRRMLELNRFLKQSDMAVLYYGGTRRMGDPLAFQAAVQVRNYDIPTLYYENGKRIYKRGRCEYACTCREKPEDNEWEHTASVAAADGFPWQYGTPEYDGYMDKLTQFLRKESFWCGRLNYRIIPHRGGALAFADALLRVHPWRRSINAACVMLGETFAEGWSEPERTVLTKFSRRCAKSVTVYVNADRFEEVQNRLGQLSMYTTCLGDCAETSGIGCAFPVPYNHNPYQFTYYQKGSACNG